MARSRTMFRTAAMVALLATVPLASQAADSTDTAPTTPFVDALVSEMDRSVAGLDFADAPDIYHLRYHVMTMEQADARAAFGQLLSESANPFNALGIELRVGSPSYDNTGFGGWQNGFGVGWLPDRVTPEALRLETWRLTDRSYKNAVEQYARKRAQFTAPPDYPGDYQLTGPVVADLGSGETPDAKALQALAVELSGAFVIDAVLERGEVVLGHEAGEHVIVDTEGTRVRRPLEETTLRAFAHARADDGLLVTDQLLWTVRRADQLPAAGEMQAAIARMAEQVAVVAKAKPLEEEYVGPVLFEDGAAVDLFRYLLVPQLEGTPDEVPFDSWFGELGMESGSSVRVGRRVLPSGWTVVEDADLQPGHPGAFTHDSEGTPTQPVTLATEGIVRTLLMSRVPRKDLAESNGHARGSLGSRATAQAAVMEITPDAALTAKQLHKRAFRIAAQYGHDHYVVVRRLQEPAIRNASEGGGGFMLFGGGDASASALPMPVSIVKIYKDGREEVLRGASFSGVHRWVLRDIVAAGPQVATSYMASASGGDPSSLGPTEGLPTWLSAPQVLVGEMELVPDHGDPRDVPIVPPPARTAR